MRQDAPSCDGWLDDDGAHLHIPAKLGTLVKIKLHRPLEGTPVTAHLVSRADGQWHILIVCETTPEDEYGSIHELTTATSETSQPTCEHADIGLGVGLKVFLADCEGAVVENPRYDCRGQQRLAKAHHVSDRRKKGSHRRGKTTREVAKKHLKISRQPRDFHVKTAKHYARRYWHICVEDLNVADMA